MKGSPLKGALLALLLEEHEPTYPWKLATSLKRRLDVVAVEKALSEINKGAKEVEVNLQTAAGSAEELMEDVPPPP